MGEATLPPGSEQPLDAEQLAPLIANAVRATAKSLQSERVDTRTRTMRRPVQRGGILDWEDVPLAIPVYRSETMHELIRGRRHSPEATALLSYLWDHGQPKKKITGDAPGVPGRDAWADFVWHEYVRNPLLFLLAQSATRAMAEYCDPTPWFVDDSELRAMARDMADVSANDRRSIRAISPVMSLHWAKDLGSTYELAPGVRIRQWDDLERRRFLIRYEDEYLADDVSTIFSAGYVEIELQTPANDPLGAVAYIATTLDQVKWALMVATGSDDSFHESATVIGGGDGHRLRTLRREALIFDGRSHNTLPLTETAVAVASRQLQTLQRSVDHVPSLSSALTFLGRALTSALPRDSLLEAAVGLESLLIASSGENSYRFRLHGAALLSLVLGDDVYDDLREIYKLRSRAAHGSHGIAVGNIQGRAARSRFLLSQAILAVIQLHESGELRDGKVPEFVEDLVRRRATNVPR